MKRLLAGILAALLMLCGCAASAEEKSTATKVCSDWFDYLYAMECAYSNLLRAAEAAEAFTDEPSWEKLQIARMAIARAERYVEKRGLDDPLMTADDYVDLMLEDKDVSFVSESGDQYGAEQQAIMDHLMVLREHMEADIYTDFEMKVVSDLIDHYQKICGIGYQYLAISTDYLLATLQDAEMTETMDQMTGTYLLQTEAYRTHITDTVVLKKNADDVLDQYAGLEVEFKKLLAASEAAKDVYVKAVETGDLSELISHMAVIENLPVMLPDTGWSINDGWEATYYWLDAEGHVAMPGEADEIDRIPDGYTITYPGVKREEVIEYCDGLKLMGLDPLSSTEEDGVLRIYYTFMDSVFVFEWADGMATINMLENPMGFVPYWYLEALYTK
ncbi:MAG: hypothetical protein IJE08_15205 [Clostridia bacterium]|nr:hypothetical protein [Clostridia bacterium]